MKKVFLINKLKEASVKVITEMVEFFKETDDVLRPTKVQKDICVICNKCQNMDDETITNTSKTFNEINKIQFKRYKCLWLCNTRWYY